MISEGCSSFSTLTRKEILIADIYTAEENVAGKLSIIHAYIIGLIFVAI